MKKPTWLYASIILLAACSGGESEAARGANLAEQGGRTATPALPRPNEGSRTISANAAIPPHDRTTCNDLIGFMTDRDPAGRNVRAGPGTQFARVGIIPAPISGTEYDPLPATFEIMGSQNGWLHIRSAMFDETLAGRVVPGVFDGEGWISGRGISVKVQTRLGFAAASHDSVILIDGRPDQFLEGWNQRGIVACTGDWVLIDWSEPPGTPPGQRPAAWSAAAILSERPLILRAWSTGVCGIYETTCDGVSGDGPFTETAAP